MDISEKDITPELNPEKWTEVLYKEIPELQQIAEIQTEQLFLEDSSDVDCSHWSKMIGYIGEQYNDYDGFVILHGTDTMAYTASALSFGLRNLGKPVILTGSQVPMSNIRSDARRNLVNSIEMATLEINEVAICFNDHLFRGNRSTKMSIGDFDAFASPNFPPLAEIGLEIEINVSAAKNKQPLEVQPNFDNRIFLLKLFPGIDPAFLEQLDLSTLRALVVEAFGSGNFPLKKNRSLVPFFKKCINQDILIAITSQAPYDSVMLSQYESGRKAQEMGALSAGDMTTEAALTKMMYILGNNHDDDTIRALYESDLAGELTEP